MYSAEVGYFDERLVEVLERIAAMLSLALDNLRREAQRAEAEASLRESEARFRSLSELTADWYWQQDDQFRFIEMAAGSTAKINSVRASRYMGKTRWEQPGLLGTEAHWNDHKAVLAAHLPFRDFEFGRLDPDGTESCISISGEPIFDKTGRFAGYRGLGRDITERKSAEHLVALEHQVGRILADSNDTETAIEEVIRAVCESRRWSYGVLLRPVEDASVLRPVQQWGIAGEVDEEFLVEERALRIAPESGMSGRV